MLRFFTLIIDFIKRDFIHLEAVGLDISFSMWDLAIFLLFAELTAYIVASVISRGGDN